MTGFIILSLLFIIPALSGAALFLLGSRLLHGDLTCDITLLGIIMSCFSYFPHEYLHAICFGKDAEVELFFSLKHLTIFVISTKPISKSRFIFLSLLPNLVFGWIPLFVWMILPFNAVFSNHLFTFSILSLSSGIGDYLNVFNTVRQMPKGSMHQGSGFHSYWFMPG